MKIIDKLIQGNKIWSQERVKTDPEFFSKLSNIQNPDFLWIGCSDSRVPANQITGTQPGEVFVHRNVSNMVINEDKNLNSVLEFGVNSLKIKHIIICGHYGCGGVSSAIKEDGVDPLKYWLSQIRKEYKENQVMLDKISDHKELVNLMCELNVLNQIGNLAHNPIIKKSWQENSAPEIHGLIYSLEDGIIKKLLSVSRSDDSDKLVENSKKLVLNRDK